MCKSWMHASEPQEIATTEPTAVEDIKRKMAGTGTLLICVVGIYACYLWYGVVQEKLYHTQDDGSKFGNTAFTMLVQCMGNALIASLVYFFGTVFGFERRVPKKDKDGNPMALESFVSVLGSADVLITAFVYVSAMYTSNEALKYVSYPMQALAKSCKLIPVLIGGMVINGKRYPVWKYVSVLLVTLGITAFQFAKQKASSSHSSKSSHEDDTFGLVLLAVSLAMDGMSGPGQERIKRFALTNTQQMLATNVWATVVMLAVSMYYDQLQPSILYMRSHPELLQTLCLFALTSAFGQLFIFYTIRSFDSLVLTTITTTRKFFTIVLSVFWFGHSLNTKQWLAVGLVFAGLVLDAYQEEMEKQRKRAGEHGPKATSAARRDR